MFVSRTAQPLVHTSSDLVFFRLGLCSGENASLAAWDAHGAGPVEDTDHQLTHNLLQKAARPRHY